MAVVTSDDGPEHTNGWAAVDGESETAWTGEVGAEGWYIALAYGETVALNGLAVDLAPDSLTDIRYLYSLDAKTWADLTPALKHPPVKLNYLWLLFPTNGTPAVPKVIEIRAK